MRALKTMALVAITLLLAVSSTHAQTTSWQRITGQGYGHWYTSFMYDSYGTVSRVHINALVKPHGYAYVVRVECSNQSGHIAVHTYGQGEIMGTLIDCRGNVAQSSMTLNQWLAAAPAFTTAMRDGLTSLDIEGLSGVPPQILD